MFKMIEGYWRQRNALKARLREQEMRRASDNYGAGSLLRYGEDRYGDPGKYRDKCKRLRDDGPTPCLMCEGECYGKE